MKLNLRGADVYRICRLARKCEQSLQIFITANEPKYSREIQVNTSVDSFMWRPLVKDVTYRVQMLAFNEIGDGVRSEAIVVGKFFISGSSLETWYFSFRSCIICITLSK